MARFQKTIDVIHRGIDEGLHLGVQLCIWRNGETLFDDGIGKAAPGVWMKRDSITLWWSSCKPFAAVAIAMLRERGLLDWNDPVTRFLPEFAAHGKQDVTIRHLLTHTAGLRAWPNVSLDAPWEQIIARLCAMKLEPRWLAGQKAGYHARSSWFILAEIIRLLDGRMFDQFAREEIFQPLQMRDTWMRISVEQYEEYRRENRLSVMLDTSKIAANDTTRKIHLPTVEEVQQFHPGGSGRGPIRELSRFYQMLLNGGELDGARILSADSIAELIAPQRTKMFDETFKRVIDWGFGFMLNTAPDLDGTQPYTFGRLASRQAFGHSGSQSSCGFCDPANRLIVCWVCNGMIGEARHQPRQREMNEAIYEEILNSEG